MARFWIRFSGIHSCEMEDWIVVEAEDIGTAETIAYEEAKEDFEQYEGLHGIGDREAYAEDGMTEDEIDAAVADEMESAIDYEVRATEPEEY
jgi:hypothetical protein